MMYFLRGSAFVAILSGICVKASTKTSIWSEPPKKNQSVWIIPIPPYKLPNGQVVTDTGKRVRGTVTEVWPQGFDGSSLYDVQEEISGDKRQRLPLRRLKPLDHFVEDLQDYEDLAQFTINNDIAALRQVAEETQKREAAEKIKEEQNAERRKKRMEKRNKRVRKRLESFAHRQEQVAIAQRIEQSQRMIPSETPRGETEEELYEYVDLIPLLISSSKARWKCAGCSEEQDYDFAPGNFVKCKGCDKKTTHWYCKCPVGGPLPVHNDDRCAACQTQRPAHDTC